MVEEQYRGGEVCAAVHPSSTVPEYPALQPCVQWPVQSEDCRLRYGGTLGTGVRGSGRSGSDGSRGSCGGSDGSTGGGVVIVAAVVGPVAYGACIHVSDSMWSC
jgi:hypothetical protein